MEGDHVWAPVDTQMQDSYILVLHDAWVCQRRTICLWSHYHIKWCLRTDVMQHIRQLIRQRRQRYFTMHTLAGHIGTAIHPDPGRPNSQISKWNPHQLFNHVLLGWQMCSVMHTVLSSVSVMKGGKRFVSGQMLLFTLVNSTSTCKSAGGEFIFFCH